jgi:hypothetical protein
VFRHQSESRNEQGGRKSRALGDATAGFRPVGIVRSGNSIAETNLETLGSFPPRRTTRCSQYPCPCTTGWGDGTTNPTPSACEPVHRGSKDRQTDGTARVHPRSNRGWSSDAVSGAVHGDTASPSGRRTRHTPHGAHVPSTNRSTPTGRNLAPSDGLDPPTALPGAMASPTPNARLGNPRRRRATPDCMRDLRSRSVHAEEDVIAFKPRSR